MKTLLLVALAVVTAGLQPAMARDHANSPTQREADKDASKYQDYLESRIKHLRSDVDRLDTRLKRGGGTYGNDVDAQKRLAELNGRLDEMEKQLKDTRAVANRDTSAERKNVEERFEKARKDFRKIEKDLRK